MDYFILTETSLFRLIRGEEKTDPNAAYQDFVVQVIELCKQPDDGYKAVALTCAETELQFVSGVSEDINLCVKKALAFVQKMLKYVTDGKTLALPCEQRRIKLKWTGKTAELVELIYGISVMGSVNDGTIQLKELVEELFNFFGIENTKGCYRIYNDIKMRKSDSRTYYLDSMRAELNHKMREEDKRFR
ncbi:MAG: Tetracycline regulation of excision, RteC [bacterium F082]|jgi:hypothetical protein|nr:MAG: Tetracycline regulation of excision, RteC [bacterium F082]